MQKKFITHYSKSNRKHQESHVIDFNSAFATKVKYEIVQGTVAYNFDNDLFSLRAYDAKTKVFINVKSIGKYHTIEKFDIKNLPVDTLHYVKKKLYGDTFWLFKVGNRYVFATEPDKDNDFLVSKLKEDVKYKWLIDKYCKNGGCAELTYSINDFYLTNLVLPNKILDWNMVSSIGEYFNIKTTKPLNSKILSYDKDLMNYFYSDYHFNDGDYMPSKEYMIMFEFRNNKYLMCKV